MDLETNQPPGITNSPGNKENIMKPEPCSKTSTDIEKSLFEVHAFAASVTEKSLVFQVIKMVESLFIFVNYENNLSFSDLSLATPTKYESAPVCINILGSFGADFSKNLASKLARRLKKRVFVSCNVDVDKLTMSAVERSLFNLIKRKPDKF